MNADAMTAAPGQQLATTPVRQYREDMPETREWKWDVTF